MNIWQRFKSWLIHKLGGVKKETCELWEKSAGYWYHKYLAENDRYNTEHENYLAMLSLYNTTVEQMQNNSMGVAGAIDTIKDYCASKNNCNECALYRAGDGCKFLVIPCYWGGMSE